MHKALCALLLALCAASLCHAGYVNPAVLRERAIAAGGARQSMVPQRDNSYAHAHTPEFTGISMLDRGERLMQRSAANLGAPGAPMARPGSNYRLYRNAAPVPADPYHVHSHTPTPDLFQQASRLPPPPAEQPPLEVDDSFVPTASSMSDMRFQQQPLQAVPSPAFAPSYGSAPPFDPASAYLPQLQSRFPPQQQLLYQHQPSAFDQQQYPEFLATESHMYAAPSPQAMAHPPVSPTAVSEAIANAYSSDRYQEGRADYNYPEASPVEPLPANQYSGPYRFRELYPSYTSTPASSLNASPGFVAPTPAPASSPVFLQTQGQPPIPSSPQPALYPNLEPAHTPTYGMYPRLKRETQGSIPPPPAMPNLPPPPVGIF